MPLLLMLALVKDGLLALVLKILILMTRTVREGQLKQMIRFQRFFFNRIVNFDQIDFIKQKKTLISCNGKQKVILLHDKTRPHVAKTVRERIENLDREVLPHPAYSPELAPSDYHLFRSYQHFFQEKIYTEVEKIKKDLDSYFSSRP